MPSLRGRGGVYVFNLSPGIIYFVCVTVSVAKGECQEAGEGELSNTVVRSAERRKMNIFQ